MILVDHADKMSGRERIMAAINGQPVDKIPFVPLIGPFSLMEMPPEITGDEARGGFDPIRCSDACRALHADLMIRHVPVTTSYRSGAIHLQMLGGFDDQVEANTEFKDGQLWETLKTPVGELSGSWQFSPKVGLIPHAVKHAVNNHEELKIFHWAVDHLDTQKVEVSPDFFFEVDAYIGQDGIPTASISNTPLMYLIEMAWGLENTYYMLNDYKAEVEDILEKLHQSLKRYVEVLAESPAEVIIQYENTSSTLLSPTIFRRYCLPYLNEYADILRDAGKVHLIHMCGTLNRMVPEIDNGHFRGICDISPKPTGDLPLDEAAASLNGKVVIGGIDPTTFINPDPGFVEKTVSDLIQKIKPYRGVMLGSADVTPRGARVENLHMVRRLVDELGTY